MKTASEIAELIQESMSSSPGISEITVDGIRVKLEPGALDYWLRKAAREDFPIKRPICANIDLS